MSWDRASRGRLHGDRCPLTIRLGVQGSVISSPSGFRGGAPAESDFMHILYFRSERIKPPGTPFSVFLSDGGAPQTSRGPGKLSPFPPFDGPDYIYPGTSSLRLDSADASASTTQLMKEMSGLWRSRNEFRLTTESGPWTPDRSLSEMTASVSWTISLSSSLCVCLPLTTNTGFTDILSTLSIPGSMLTYSLNAHKTQLCTSLFTVNGSTKITRAVL